MLKINQFSITLLLSLLSFCVSAQKTVYFPERGKEWAQKDPADFNIDKNKLDLAVTFAKDNEYSGSKDLRIAILEGFRHEPFHEIAGPTKKRGAPAGVIIKNGYVIAKWGDVHRVDMTFSVTKSYLSTIAGLAIDKGLISNVNDKVAEYVWDNTFRGEHNSKISWEHLLNQSSDWSGELFGMKDWADRPPREGDIDDWKNRKINEPGTFFKYNDVRVNVLAYSLLQVWRKPLPQILKENIMDPIGASSTWRWFGYNHAWATVDGLQIRPTSFAVDSRLGSRVSARRSSSLNRSGSFRHAPGGEVTGFVQELYCPGLAGEEEPAGHDG